MPEKPQPQVQAYPADKVQGSKFGNKWLFGVFDCFSPFGLCCLGTWCPVRLKPVRFDTIADYSSVLSLGKHMLASMERVRPVAVA